MSREPTCAVDWCVTQSGLLLATALDKKKKKREKKRGARKPKRRIYRPVPPKDSFRARFISYLHGDFSRRRVSDMKEISRPCRSAQVNSVSYSY